jgi:type IV secretory pathway VirD2 relaxase
MSGEDEFEIRPGRVGDPEGGSLARSGGRKAQTLAAQVRRAAARAGYSRSAPGCGRTGRGTGHRGRGRIAMLRMRPTPNARRVVVKAWVIQHKGAHFRAAPIGRHIAYLRRDGVTRDGQGADLFDARGDQADGDAFAARCEDDRHHFRFMISPEEAGEMADLRAFTRELMQEVAQDLETPLDWVAVDHWNTDNPHIHVLIRGRLPDGEDLVIDGDYLKAGMRNRAEARVTLELGPRSEREIRSGLEREVEADRWTRLDERLQRTADEAAGVADLRPGDPDADPEWRRLLLGRAAKLERLGLADRIGPAVWTLKPGLETTLRDLGVRGDIIKTMHRAMSRGDRPVDLSAFALHGGAPADAVIGRLVERGLHNELEGTAYAVIAGADGRTHHVPFDNLELTGDARPGAIVEVRAWEDDKGRTRLSLSTRSDLSLVQQVTAPGATWLDRQLLARESVAIGGGFGHDIRAAMEARAEHLASEGLARRQGQRFVFAKDLLNTLKDRELADAVAAVGQRTGLAHQPSSAVGEHVAGVYRERVTLASGRFAMIDDGLGFQLVPWRPALEQQLGRQVSGVMGPGGGVDWMLGRKRGLGL